MRTTICVFKLHFDKTKLVYYCFFDNYHKPYATSIFFFYILRLVCVHSHVKTLCARMCVFDWSKKGCGRSNATSINMRGSHYLRPNLWRKWYKNVITNILLSRNINNIIAGNRNFRRGIPYPTLTMSHFLRKTPTYIRQWIYNITTAFAKSLTARARRANVSLIVIRLNRA